MTDPFAAAVAAAQAAQQAAATLAQENTALTQQHAADQATIAQLEAEINNPPQSGTAFGIDLSNLGPDAPLTEAQKVNAHRALGLKLTNVRVFFGGSVPTWNSERIKALDPTKGDSILISTLSRDVAGMTAFCKATPDEWRGHVQWAHGHEREADLLKSSNPTAAVADWLAGNAEKATMLDGLGSWGYSSDDLVKIMLWYSQTQDKTCKGTQEKFYGGQDFGMWGMDCYHYAAWLNKADRYATNAELFDPVLTFAKQIGRPVCIPEWGGTLAATDKTGSRRAAAIVSGAAYLKAHGAVFANWWCAAGSKNSDGSYPNHHLEQVAGANSPEVAAYVKL